MVLGSGLLIVLEKDTSNLQWISLSLVGGIGAGLLFPALTVALQASSTNSGMAYAVILFSTFRALGQTIGVAVGGVVFQNVIEKELETYPLLAPYASIYSRDAGRIMKIILAAPAGLEQTQLIHSCMQALKAVYIVCTAVAATGLFFSFYIQELSLDRPLETAHGFIHSTESDDEETKVL
jgi:MFS family permease